MPLLKAFTGGTYRALSPTLGADLAINVFQETRRTEGSAKTKWLLGTPGLKSFIAGTGNGCRGSFTFDGLALTVIDSTLYRVDLGAQVKTSLGTIADNGEPVSFSSNGKGGNQIAIVGGGQIKILNTVTLTLSAAVTLPFTDPVMIGFLDGYFLANQRGTPTIWFSALEDGTTWDALDFIARSGSADNVVGIGVAQDRVWAFGTQTTTLFYDSGDADTPFLPYPGTVTQIGCASPWAIALRNDLFTWLAQDKDGNYSVVKASGVPSPKTVSTPPIELWLRQCADVTQTRVLAYQTEGHAFVALTCPSSPDDVQTYVWDDTEGEWHARAGWNATTGRFTRWRAQGVMQGNGLIVVGDYTTGDLYALDLETYADNGAPLIAVRRMPYVSDENQWMFIDQIELGAHVGVGLVTGQGAAPVADLKISRDAAKTWIPAGAASLGALGAYATRAIWRRLGRVRMDRLVIEVSQSDPVRRAWIGLWLRSTAGTGQL